MLKIIALCLICYLVALPSWGRSFTFAVVPQQSASALAKNWVPITQYLSQETGLDIQFATAPNIPEFERRLARGEYDLAYINPYHFVVYHGAPGYQALVKAKDKKIKGIMVVKKDAPYTSLQQLEGQELAFPAPAAFAASMLPRSHLEQADIDFSAKYVLSHDSVYRNVAKGFYAAGGGVMRTFNSVPESVREQLRILWTSPQYTPHAFVSHPDMATEINARLKEALLMMGETAQGQALLAAIKLKGLEPAKNQDWDDVRALNISSPIASQ